MKLIVMVPCWNEEATLPLVIDSIPERVQGVDRIETLIVDDGSSDRTVEVARRCGVDHIVKLKQHRGLAAAFQAEKADIAIGRRCGPVVGTPLLNHA